MKTTIQSLPNNKACRTAHEICKQIQQKGYIAYFVGGCVRDMILGFTIKDYDLVTDMPMSMIKEMFDTCDVGGEKYGITRISMNDYIFEIANFRCDGVYKDGRHPESVSIGTPEEDAQRRDFTINALFLDPETRTIYDYVGGLDDITGEVVNLTCVGDPEERFTEDKLRMLRFCRFAAYTALTNTVSVKTDKRVIDCIIKNAHLIHEVSAERIQVELIKILNCSPNGLNILLQTGLLFEIIPELQRLQGCEQPAEYHPEGDVFEHTYNAYIVGPHTYTRGMSWKSIVKSRCFNLAVLLHDIGKPDTKDIIDGRIKFINHELVGADITRNIMKRLKFSNQEIEEVTWLIKNHMKIKYYFDMKKSKRLKLNSHPLFKELVVLHIKDSVSSKRSSEEINPFLKLLLQNFNTVSTEKKDLSTGPAPFITGDDLIKLGLIPGPSFKRILSKVYDMQVDEELKTVEECIQFVQANWKDL